jgi:hypothetical protein
MLSSNFSTYVSFHSLLRETVKTGAALQIDKAQAERGLLPT